MPSSKLHPDINHKVSAKTAKAQIAAWKKDPHPSDPRANGGFFGRSYLLRLLSEPGCIGLRYHYAKKSKNKLTLVLSVETAKGKKVPLEKRMLGNDPPICPPFCG